MKPASILITDDGVWKRGLFSRGLDQSTFFHPVMHDVHREAQFLGRFPLCVALIGDEFAGFVLKLPGIMFASHGNSLLQPDYPASGRAHQTWGRSEATVGMYGE